MKKLVVLSAAVALGACNSDPGTTITTQDGEKITINGDGSGNDGTISIKSDKGEFNIQAGPNAKVALPAGFTVYPGAEVVSNASMNTDGRQSSTLTINTPAGLDQVVAFYRKQAESAGVDIATEIKAGNAVMLGGESKSGMVFSLNAGPADAGTTAHISLSQK